MLGETTLSEPIKDKEHNERWSYLDNGNITHAAVQWMTWTSEIATTTCCGLGYSGPYWNNKSIGPVTCLECIACSGCFACREKPYDV